MDIYPHIKLVVRKLDYINHLQHFGNPTSEKNLDHYLVELEYKYVGLAHFGGFLYDLNIPHDLTRLDEHGLVIQHEECRVLASGETQIKYFTPKEEDYPSLSWTNQEMIMIFRTVAQVYLERLSPSKLKYLVSKYAAMVFSEPEVANALTNYVVGNGKESQVRYLLNKGFLPEGVQRIKVKG